MRARVRMRVRMRVRVRVRVAQMSTPGASKPCSSTPGARGMGG